MTDPYPFNTAVLSKELLAECRAKLERDHIAPVEWKGRSWYVMFGGATESEARELGLVSAPPEVRAKFGITDNDYPMWML